MATSSEGTDAINLGALGDLVGYHMRRASAVIGNDFGRVMQGTGIRQVLFGILSIIDANPGINQGSVGRALGIQRANMVSLVNELVDADLVARDVAPDDRRAFSLTLTPAGQAKVHDALSRIREHESGLLGDLSAKQRSTLLNLLSRIEAKES